MVLFTVKYRLVEYYTRSPRLHTCANDEPASIRNEGHGWYSLGQAHPSIIALKLSVSDCRLLGQVYYVGTEPKSMT